MGSCSFALHTVRLGRERGGDGVLSGSNLVAQRNWAAFGKVAKNRGRKEGVPNDGRALELFHAYFTFVFAYDI